MTKYRFLIWKVLKMIQVTLHKKGSSPLTLICIKWVPGKPSTIFLATIFTQKMPESSGTMYCSILMLKNIWYYHFTWSESNSQEIVNFFQFSLDPQLEQKGPTIGTKSPISGEFAPLQVKWWCHMFSNMK